MLKGLGAVAAAVVLAGSGTVARSQPDAAVIGIRGSTANHEGTPLPAGTVTLRSPDHRSVVTASLDPSGRFQIVPTAAGRQRLTIVVPGYAPRLADVIVPASRTIALPALLLEAPAYFRARFVNSDGEVIVSPVIRRRSIGVDGVALAGPDADGFPRVDTDGGITIGPVPAGVTAMALDMPGLAQTRLPDVTVRGEDGVIDGGTIVIQPGTVLRVAIVDGDGAPVANYPVAVEDMLPNSPLAARTARTDQEGRAMFERLGAGRYRVSASMLDRCNGRLALSTGQQLRVNGTGQAAARITVGGRAALRVTSPQGPLAGRTVSLTPEPGEHAVITRTIAMPGRPPIILAPPGCSGSTDGDGRATFTHVPRGAALVAVRLHNSTFEHRVSLPGDGSDVTIEVPDGFIQLRVIDASTGRPVPRAAVAWSGGGSRVSATATGSGDALLEGVGESPGSIAVTAPGFGDAEVKVPALAPPIEVALTPAPSSDRRVRVVSDTGEPIAQAILLLAPATAFDVGVYAASDENGVVGFTNVPRGVARVVAEAEGFVGAALNLRANSDAPATLTLTRRKD